MPASAAFIGPLTKEYPSRGYRADRLIFAGFGIGAATALTYLSFSSAWWINSAPLRVNTAMLPFISTAACPFMQFFHAISAGWLLSTLSLCSTVCQFCSCALAHTIHLGRSFVRDNFRQPISLMSLPFHLRGSYYPTV